MIAQHESTVWQYICSVYLQSLDGLNLSREGSGLTFWAVYMHMICFKLGRLIKQELRGPQSCPGLYYGRQPTLKYWLAVTKRHPLESLCTVFMTLKITTPCSEAAQIQKKEKKHYLAKLFVT